ncbi:PRC-barrel domain-containing protein [Sphingomonas sp. DT-51]|uniref:PRC-barrel domain-containing protein n=1 Tax=Sphingomonas sp. DT-51 TaxID=3396165 RepID=UPI003F1D69BA
MTAANLGARVTGWGFVVFTVGAAGWIVVGLASGQQQLLYSNLFLGIVDLFGIWRWLGRRARISDATRAEERRSTKLPGEALFSVTSLDGLPVRAVDGSVAAHAVDALAGCGGGEIEYLVVRIGGLGGIAETLHRLPWSDVSVRDGEVHTGRRPEEFPELAAIAQ